jgi:hypothetical protein
MLRHVVLALSIVALAGCSGGKGQKSAPEPDPDLPAPSAEEIATIRTHLAPLQKAQKWSGDRLRVTGVRDGLPVTESIGPWEVETAPAGKEGVIELRGIRIGSERSVQLDLARGLLLIDGQPFAGRALTGKSPTANNAPFKGPCSSAGPETFLARRRSWCWRTAA